MLPKPKDILPQQPPFLFLDEYLELDDSHCLAKYTFKENEWFFKGHFPDEPIVPGVILIEAMAQAGVVSIGICHISKNKGVPMEDVKKSKLAFFTNADNVEFSEMVRPKDTIFISCRLIFSRFSRYETEGEIYKIIDGEKKIICKHKSLIGQGVNVNQGGVQNGKK